LRGHGPAMARHHHGSAADGLHVLPSEEIQNAEAIVNGGINGVEGAMRVLRRIVVARSKVVLAEDA
jgi:hypothetical protein